MTRKNLIKECLLNNEEVLFDVVQQLNSWNGCLEWLEFYDNDEEFFETFFKDRLELARAICYGDYNYNDGYVRFDGYGNLESISEHDMMELLEDSIEEIVENLMQYKNHIYTGDDENLEELLYCEDEEDED